MLQLKEKGWISAVTAGVTDTDGYDSGTYAAKFDITMKLTLEGIAHWEEIVHAVFEYLHMLKVNGCPEWVFDELAALADISFRFQEDESAVARCEELGEIMQVRAHDVYIVLHLSCGVFHLICHLVLFIVADPSLGVPVNVQSRTGRHLAL